MRLAKKYPVPPRIGLLYEFLNSADLRTYVEKGEQHVPTDELATPELLATWMRKRALLNKQDSITAAEYRRALELRSALRSFLRLPNAARESVRSLAELFNRASRCYPLVVKMEQSGSAKLEPAPGANGLGEVLAQFYSLDDSGHLDRLKMCSSDECQWVFFDRSKPANRRWCSSMLCGNRQKTRDYRERTKAGAGSA